MARLGTIAQDLGGGVRIWMLVLLLLLTFDNFPIVPAGRQIIVEVMGILDNSPTNAPGTQFVNTAKWGFDTFEVETQ